MVILKIILFFLIMYYVLGIVARIAVPYIMRFLVQKTVSQAQKNAQQFENNKQKQTADRGYDFDESNSGATNSQPSSSQASANIGDKTFRGGEYIEFEETNLKQ